MHQIPKRSKADQTKNARRFKPLFHHACSSSTSSDCDSRIFARTFKQNNLLIHLQSNHQLQSAQLDLAHIEGTTSVCSISLRMTNREHKGNSIFTTKREHRERERGGKKEKERTMPIEAPCLHEAAGKYLLCNQR